MTPHLPVSPGKQEADAEQKWGEAINLSAQGGLLPPIKLHFPRFHTLTKQYLLGTQILKHISL